MVLVVLIAHFCAAYAYSVFALFWTDLRHHWREAFSVAGNTSLINIGKYLFVMLFAVQMFAFVVSFMTAPALLLSVPAAFVAAKNSRSAAKHFTALGTLAGVLFGVLNFKPTRTPGAFDTISCLIFGITFAVVVFWLCNRRQRESDASVSRVPCSGISARDDAGLGHAATPRA
ncbi:hypothetical protein PQI07_19050 [Methylobacterium sp. 092160098-2]|uniref:hypothetical protein n=1 Tax=Methylobacterium sp. 092160098-2 TaxID=3025129 RepID=UPI002381C87E|nr:hypothetical protein [Methylobacterium sp. 092160098-2]MDE4912784.1 hypothetical protein [Methylobacterium sp. 092160098-2]